MRKLNVILLTLNILWTSQHFYWIVELRGEGHRLNFVYCWVHPGIL